MELTQAQKDVVNQYDVLRAVLAGPREEAEEKPVLPEPLSGSPANRFAPSSFRRQGGDKSLQPPHAWITFYAPHSAARFPNPPSRAPLCVLSLDIPIVIG